MNTQLSEVAALLREAADKLESPEPFVDPGSRGIHCANCGKAMSIVTGYRYAVCAKCAIHARVAELVAKAREEGRQEALHPPIEIDPDWMRHFPTGTITAIGKPDAFDKVLASDPPPIFTPTETGATP